MSDSGDAQGVDRGLNVVGRHWLLITEPEVQQSLCHFSSAMQPGEKSFYHQIKGACQGNGLNVSAVSTRSGG